MLDFPHSVFEIPDAILEMIKDDRESSDVTLELSNRLSELADEPL